MLARHEEIRCQKQGAEKSVIVGFPAERTTNVEIRHTHARHEEIRHHPCGPSQPVHMCRQTSTQFGLIKVFLGYPSGTCFILCLAPTPALPEIFWLPAKDACRNIITICRPTQDKKGDSAYLLQFVLSDKHRHVEQELLFLPQHC